MSRITIGVSACLIGEPVRYDGGHKRDDFIVRTLGSYAKLIAVCPEVELGLGTPRETLRLVRRADDVRLVMADGHDYTDAMRAFAASRVAALEREDLDGYILKRNSPSCGVDGVAVHGSRGSRSRDGRGLFAAALIQRFPNLPVEDEGRLADPACRDRFIERVSAYRRVKTLFRPRWTMKAVAIFHATHRLVLIGRSVSACRALDRLVMNGRRLERHAFRDRYISGFMRALATAPVSQ